MQTNQRMLVVRAALLAGAFVIYAGVGPALVQGENSLTGIWRGTYVTQDEVVSNGYLDITEHADGALSGKWGNGPRGALTIEQGERVTADTFQWEAPSPAHVRGRYRVRATLRGKTLQLDVTYTWRVDGKIKGLTAVSALNRE